MYIERSLHSVRNLRIPSGIGQFLGEGEIYRWKWIKFWKRWLFAFVLSSGWNCEARRSLSLNTENSLDQPHAFSLGDSLMTYQLDRYSLTVMLTLATLKIKFKRISLVL